MLYCRSPRITPGFSYCPCPINHQVILLFYASWSHYSTYLFIQGMVFKHQHSSRFFFIHTTGLWSNLTILTTVVSSKVSLVPFSLIQYMPNSASFITQKPCHSQISCMSMLQNSAYFISHGLCGHAINGTAFWNDFCLVEWVSLKYPCFLVYRSIKTKQHIC